MRRSPNNCKTLYVAQQLVQHFKIIYIYIYIYMYILLLLRSLPPFFETLFVPRKSIIYFENMRFSFGKLSCSKKVGFC